MRGHSTVHLLTAMQHADGQFPSGGFAFSQGLEAASQLAAHLGGFDFAEFLHVQIRHRWTGSDRVALIRAYRLRGDLAALSVLDSEVEASTLTEGLRTGSRRNGSALLTAHERIGTPRAGEYRNLVKAGSALGHLSVVQGLVWQALELDETAAVAISGYQAITSLTTAAVRLGLIGAIEAQRLIAGSMPLVVDGCDVAVGDDEPLCSFVPLTEIAIASHGTTGQKLFSN